jgi:septum formation protein
MSARSLVLASASPRRIQMMREAGYTIEVVVPDVEEAHDPALTCDALTIENARRKASVVAAARPHAIVIAADTLVYIDGHPLAKPADLNEGREMLRRLSGHTHQVCTGVAIACDDVIETFAVITDVTFKSLSEDAITAYHALVNVLDKAGGYAVQEHGNLIIESVAGSRTNVIGLPMDELRVALARHGL